MLIAYLYLFYPIRCRLARGFGKKDDENRKFFTNWMEQGCFYSFRASRTERFRVAQVLWLLQIASPPETLRWARGSEGCFESPFRGKSLAERSSFLLCHKQQTKRSLSFTRPACREFLRGLFGAGAPSMSEGELPTYWPHPQAGGRAGAPVIPPRLNQLSVKSPVRRPG